MEPGAYKQIVTAWIQNGKNFERQKEKRMIPREALEGVRKIIVHANGPTSPCADGRAAAIILRHAFRHVRGLEIVEMAR